MNKEELKRNPLSVLALRLISPGYSRCEICGLPWNHCEEHSIQLNDYHSVFATCEYCWEHSTREQILDAYYKAYTKYWIGKPGCQFKEIFGCLEKELQSKEIN